MKAFPEALNPPNVLYPTVDMSILDRPPSPPSAAVQLLGQKYTLFVSVNRFERKKNVSLAINAFSQLQELLPQEQFQSLRLVLAGGYDERVAENVEHLQELKALAAHVKVLDRCSSFYFDFIYVG